MTCHKVNQFRRRKENRFQVAFHAFRYRILAQHVQGVPCRGARNECDPKYRFISIGVLRRNRCELLCVPRAETVRVHAANSRSEVELPIRGNVTH
jgi:hypothetical protein